MAVTKAKLSYIDGITATTTELNYADGVTSAIQTQLDAKASITGTETLTNKTLTSPTISDPTLTGSYTFTSDATTESAMTLTASNLNDGVGALRINGAQADIFLNPSTATHTTVTFAVNSDQRLAFGMDSSSDFYITRRTSSTWYDDTFVIDRDTGLLTLGYGATVSGTLTYSTLNDGTTALTSTVAELNYVDGVTSNIQTQLDAKLALAGGTMTGDLDFGDSVEARLGASQDFRIYHNGTSSYLDNATGVLYIRNTETASTGTINMQVDDSSGTAHNTIRCVGGVAAPYAELRYDNSIKLVTDSGGVTVTGVMTGTATAARYADLAERYAADAEYTPGTVLVFGGEKEVTQSTTKMDRRKAGIVSTAPAHLMNAEAGDDATHPPVALQGRVPCRVIGEVRKGDLMVTSSVPGCAEAWREEGDPRYGSVIGKSLVDKTSTQEELIEVACGVI